MKLIQKAFLYKLEAEIRNGKLIYTQKRLLSKISKECNLYDFDDEIYESVYKDWRIGIIAAILFLLAGFIIIDIYVDSNTIDNFLFYFIPAVILTILFFVTMRKTVYINSRAGIFEFLYTEEALYLLSGLISEYNTLYKKYNIKEFTGKYLSEQLEEIKNAVDLKSMSKKEIKEIDNVLAKLDKNSNLAKKLIESRKQYVAYLNELDKKVIESGRTISAVDSTQKENNKPHKLEQQLDSTYNEIASNHYDKKLSKLNKEKENAEAILKHFDKGLIHNLNIRKIDKLNKKIKLVENKKEQTITSSHIGDKYLSEKNIKLEEQKAKILSLNKIVENSKGLSKFVYSAVNEKEKIAYSINTKISKVLTMFQKVSFQTKVVVDGVKDALAAMLTPPKKQVQTHSQQLVRA